MHAELVPEEEVAAAMCADQMEGQTRQQGGNTQFWKHQNPVDMSDEVVHVTVCGVLRRTCCKILLIFTPILLGGTVGILFWLKSGNDDATASPTTDAAGNLAMIMPTTPRTANPTSRFTDLATATDTLATASPVIGTASPTSTFTDLPTPGFTEFLTGGFTEFATGGFTEFATGGFTEFVTTSFTEFASTGVSDPLQ